MYCDKVPTEASVLAQVAAALDHYGGDDVYKDCGVGWIVLRALELQERKNDKPSAQVTARGAESYHENHTKIFFFYCSHRAHPAENETQYVIVCVAQ